MKRSSCTYPRTDSRYLTSDMAASLPELVRLTAGALPFAGGMEISCNAAQVINDKKVTDHHAVIPTRNLQGADLSGLPLGEKAVLELVALRLLCAVAQPYTFAETAATVECAGAEFTAKGPHSEKSRLAGAGRCLPRWAEKFGAGQRSRG